MPPVRYSFFETTFLLSGYLAKADGHISQQEIDHTEMVIAQMGLGAEQRKRVPALKKRDKSAVIITSEGTALGRDQTMTVKCRATVHEDNAALKAWFYPALAMKLNQGDEAGAEVFRKFLDTPKRVIIELTPVKWITYDGVKLAAHVAGQWSPDQPWEEELPPAPAWLES